MSNENPEPDVDASNGNETGATEDVEKRDERDDRPDERPDDTETE